MKPAPTIAAVAEQLTAETGRTWTADGVLRAVAEHHFLRQEWRPTLLISLPANWPLIDAETGAATSIPYRAQAKVGHAYFYLWQILDGAQEGDAVGTPPELEIDGRRFRTTKPVPASAIRLLSHDIAVLAQSEAPPSQAPFAAAAPGTIPAPPPTKPSRRSQQIEMIINVCQALGFDPTAIPTGGKSRIKDACTLNTTLFTTEGFREAWKEACRQGVVRMADRDKFLSGE